MIRTVFAILGILFIVFNVHAEEDIAIIIEKQSIELNQKEEIIRKESERLKTLKKDLSPPKNLEKPPKIGLLGGYFKEINQGRI